MFFYMKTMLNSKFNKRLKLCRLCGRPGWRISRRWRRHIWWLSANRYWHWFNWWFGLWGQHGALELDGWPTFVETITDSHLNGTVMIPYGYWRRHIPMGGLKAPIYLLTIENTWMLTIMHNSSKFGSKKGGKGSFVTMELASEINFISHSLNPLEVTFFVWIEKA